MRPEVIVHSGQDHRVRFHAAKESVAGAAEHLPNCAALVAMIDYERGLNSTDGASTVLGRCHRFDFRYGQPVMLLQPLTQIDRASGVRVSRAPTTQPLVALRAIAGRIFGTAAVRTVATVRSPVATRFSERREWQSLSAIRAGSRVHAGTLHQQDQPCHADVLLELANPARAA